MNLDSGSVTVAWQLEGKTTYALEGSVFVAGAVACEQLDLDGVHRVDVGVPQPHPVLEDRMPVAQRLRVDDREHRFDRAPMLRGEKPPNAVAVGARRHEVEVDGAAISKLDFASVISRSTSARRNGQSR